MYMRRFYYDKTHGGAVYYWSMIGETIITPTVDEDYEQSPALHEYTDRRGEIGLFEWQEPDPDVEDAFARAYGVSVDLDQNPPKLAFDFEPPQMPESEPDERDEALRILGVYVNG